MAASKTIGGINVTITATVDKFQRQMKAAQRILSTFGKAISKTVFSLKGLAAAMSVAAFTKLTHNAAEGIDAMAKASDKLGISTEKLAAFQLAAQEAGISNETLERSLAKLSTATGKRADDALLDLIDRAAGLSTETEKLSLATQAFGAKGSSMVAILKLGRNGMREAEVAAKAMGLSLSRESAAGVERALDAFGRLKTTVSGLFRQIAVEIAPFIEVISTKLAGFLQQGGRVQSFGRSVAGAIIKTSAFVADSIQKMVAAVMSFIDSARGLMIGFRSSSFAKTYGMGFADVDEENSARLALRQSRQRTSAFMATPWGDSIRKGADAARRAAASQAADIARQQAGGGLLSRILKGAGRDMLGGAQQKLNSITSGPLAQMLKLYGKTALFGVGRTPAATGASGNANLMLAESGSIEGYRQQAAIRRQGDQIQKKQLSTQQKMEQHLAKMSRQAVVLHDLNLAGG